MREIDNANVQELREKTKGVLTTIEELIAIAQGENGLPGEKAIPELGAEESADGGTGTKGKGLSPLDQLRGEIAVLQSTTISELQGVVGLLGLDVQELQGLQTLPETVHTLEQQIAKLRHEIEHPNINNLIRALRDRGYSSDQPAWLNSF